MQRMEAIPNNALRLLGFPSFPSELQAAFLRDVLMQMMSENNITAVVFRYPQIKAGEDNAYRSAAFSSIIFFAFASIILTETNFLANHKYLFLFLALIEVVSSSGFFVSFGNYRYYNQSVNNCEKWLKDKAGNKFVNSLQEFGYDHSGFFGIKKLLTDNRLSIEINANSLPKQFKNLAVKAK